MVGATNRPAERFFPFHGKVKYDALKGALPRPPQGGPSMQATRARYPGLAPAHFTHPADEAALQTVRNLPLINTVLKRMIQYGYEKMLRVQAMSDSVKATRRSYATLHEALCDICERLDMPLPDLFVKQHPVPNAQSTGAEFPFIVVHTGLVDLLSDDEVYCVLAHECGHMKCGHVLYHMVARFLTATAEMLGVAGLPLQGMLIGLMEWSRKAELTADRAALLCAQDAGLIQNALMKLAGGSTRLTGQVDFEDFLRQSDMFEAMTAGLNLNKFYRLLAVLPMTHPFATVRAAEIGRWSHSAQYGTLVRGEYMPQPPPHRKPLTTCPHCGAGLAGLESQCPRCGNMTVSMGEHHRSKSDDLLREVFTKTTTGARDTLDKALEELRDLFEQLNPWKNAKDGANAEEPSPKHACVVCGTLNDADARFCKQCAGPL